jgi:uncharacterized protein (TIGR02996 family)
MESEDLALWRAVVADPHDDAPRLILADWLEERERSERAEFIRVQCAIAQSDESAADWPALRQREEQLWLKHKPEWRSSLPARMRGFKFRRGFVHPRGIHLTARQFLQLGDDAFARAPLWDVSLELRDQVSLDGLIHADRLRQLAALELECAEVDPGRLADLLAAPNLENVRSLKLRGRPFTLDHVRAVSESPALARLTRLAVFSNTLGRDGAEVLAGAEGLRHLEILELVYCGLGDAGLRALLGSPHLTRLKELRVPQNGLTAAAVRALAECRHLRGLRVLDLEHNSLDDDGARVLSLCPAVERLTRLDLGFNHIHRPGAESLAQSPFLARIRQLFLLGNPCAQDPATVTGLRFRFGDRVALTER